MARRDDHLMLMRIIAILFCMAALAEGLIGVSPHRRRLVLRVLRPAEAVAREFVAGEAGARDLRGLPSPTPFDGDGLEDALRLALCFRALALALGAVLAQIAAFGASPEQAHQPFYQRARLTLHQLVFAPVTVLDTS